MVKRYQLVRFILILFAVIGLSACASQQERLNKGRQGLESGNYVQALRYLRPLAREGNADAQYALGYMYYYGRGVVENPETARLWISRAAAQGYPVAINALKMMDSEAATAKRVARTKRSYVSPSPTGLAGDLQK